MNYKYELIKGPLMFISLFKKKNCGVTGFRFKRYGLLCLIRKTSFSP